MRDTLVDLFDAYHSDLAMLSRLVSGDLNRRRRPAVDLLGKLGLETARLLVYEQFFLLPVLRDAVSDGDAVAAREAERLETVADRMRELEALSPDDAAFDGALRAYVAAVAELGEQRRSTVYPALTNALDRRQLEDIGERVTPTHAAGATHSHPTEAKRYASEWPRPGFLDDMVRVFAEEVRLREPGLVPVLGRTRA
jgi:hypothetical protein